MHALRIPLRVVFYMDEGVWVAHCLEFDLMGDGPTREAALEQLSIAIEIQVETSIEHNNPRNIFKAADAEIFVKFAAGKDVTVGELRLKIDSVTIDETETREYTEADDFVGV